MRCSVRLSVIEFMQESGLQRCLIHNYGHSGSGVTVVMTGYTTDVPFQMKPRRRVKRFLFQPNVRAQYFSSLKPGRTYEVRVRMKLIGNRSFGPHGNLTVTL